MTIPSAGRGEWIEGGPHEVIPGTFRIPLPLPSDGLKAVNVYAIVEDDGLVLVDSGWAIPEARLRLDKALAALGATAADVKRILVTHVHRDHYTLGVALRREFGTRVSLGAGERDSLALIHQPTWRPLGTQIEALALQGADEVAKKLGAELHELEGEARSIWALPDDWLVPGELELDSGRNLEVVETPGHTRGHLVFHERAAGILFAGDHVLPAITPSIGFEPVVSENPLGHFLDSLAAVRALPDATLLPAHGPVAPSVHARIDELVAHHGRRLDGTEDAVRKGAETGYEVASLLRWTRREREMSELDVFNQMLAVLETAAHLVLLEAQGRVRRHLEEKAYRYQLA